MIIKIQLLRPKRNAPLLVGVGEGEFYAASDVPAIIKHTNRAMYLNDNEIVTLTPEKMLLVNSDGKELQPKIETLPLGAGCTQQTRL